MEEYPKKRYLIDLTTVTPEGIYELAMSGRLAGIALVHIGFFKIINSLEETISYAASIEKLYELSKETGLFRVDITNHMPKGLSYRDFKENRAHFLLTVAIDLDAAIITADSKLEAMASASDVEILRVSMKRKLPSFTSYFEEDVMSVHLKEGVPPMIKRGRPGEWRLEYISDHPITRGELEMISREIHEYTIASGESVKEIIKENSLIAQMGQYRIVITKPPLSDGMELTIVKPLRKLRLSDYTLSSKLLKRLEEQAEGILIAGAPGMGKTTFAQALAEFYYEKGKIVKTVESPRDMQLPPEVTQLSKSYANSEELHDILLLSRPDYTIYDELRDTKDFELFIDLRLAGVGMVGVIHATSPIDAIQRFINRAELGMIPSIIDTVIFIKNGDIEKVYTLETTIKVPHGLTESDLARPVVLVKDFNTGRPEYEIYVFGERTFVVPIKSRLSRRHTEATRRIENMLGKYVPINEIDIESIDDRKILIKIPAEYAPTVLSRTRKKMERLSRRLGIKLEVKPK